MSLPAPDRKFLSSCLKNQEDLGPFRALYTSFFPHLESCLRSFEMVTAELELIYEETEPKIEDCIYHIQGVWQQAAREDPKVERLSHENQHRLDTWAEKALEYVWDHLNTRMGLGDEAGHGTFFPRRPYEAILKCFKDLKQHATRRIPFEDLVVSQFHWIEPSLAGSSPLCSTHATLHVALEYCEVTFSRFSSIHPTACETSPCLD